MEYIKKMKGTTKSPPSVDFFEIVWSWIGAFLGITPVAIINYYEFSNKVQKLGVELKVADFRDV